MDVVDGNRSPGRVHGRLCGLWPVACLSKVIMIGSFVCCTVHSRGTRPELSTPVPGPTTATWALPACLVGLDFVTDFYLGFNLKREAATVTVSGRALSFCL